MAPRPKSNHHPLVVTALLVGLSACTPGPDELPIFGVELRLGGAPPQNGRVGDYEITFTEGWIVLGDWWIYGMDRETAGYATLLKHAGHAHGEADFETQVEGTYAVNLIGEPTVLATPDLTEGHYFDGSLRLRPCTALYAPVHAEDLSPLDSTDDLWGHAFLLSGAATTDASHTYDFRIIVDAEAMIAGLVYGSTVWEGGVLPASVLSLAAA